MTPQWQVPLFDLELSDEEVNAVAAVLRSGWLSLGPETERFEQAFAEYTGSRDAVAVTNGTAALHLALLAGGVSSGDEVIVPSLTFVATAAAIEYAGATPVFADIRGLDQPWLSASACEEAITERTTAILAVAYGGHSGEIEALRELAAARGLLLLEDAAHATGSRLDGRHLGTFGKAGAFSFYANKNLAVGEGGAVITDDSETAAMIRLLRSHGLTRPTWQRHHQGGSYDVTALGFNYRIDEPRAALARLRLQRLDEENRRRQHLDRRYRQLLSETCAVGLIRDEPPELVSSHHLFTIVLPRRADRDALRERLAGRGIQTSVHYPPVHRFSRYAVAETRLPVTEDYAARTLTLPMFAAMAPEQQDLVVAALSDCLAGHSSGRH